ncbi:hypothetical protein [Belliella baltica]|nr:hypothetical protein [Belliella baltica]
MFLLGCSSRKSKKDPILDYIESITSSELQEGLSYVLVSDYSCSACKEEVYLDIERGSLETHYIVMDPRNKAILKERFKVAISHDIFHIDSLGLNKKIGIILDKPISVIFEKDEWLKKQDL